MTPTIVGFTAAYQTGDPTAVIVEMANTAGTLVNRSFNLIVFCHL